MRKDKKKPVIKQEFLTPTSVKGLCGVAVMDSRTDNGMDYVAEHPALANAIQIMKARAVPERREPTLREVTEDLLTALEGLVEQFHAYRNGWLGRDVWRTRVGLPGDLQRAEDTIAAAKKALGR